MAGTGGSRAGSRDAGGRGTAPVSPLTIVFFAVLVVVWTVVGARSISGGVGLTTVFWFGLAALNAVQVGVLVLRNRRNRS